MSIRRHIFYILLFWFFSYPVYSQKIIKKIGSYVLIDIDQTSGLAPGDEIPVFRNDVFGVTEQIGKIAIIKFQDGKYAAKIISENPDFIISINDFIELPGSKKTPKAEPEQEISLDDLLSVPKDNSSSRPEAFQSTASFQISRVVRPYALIEADETTGLNKGQQLTVHRNMPDGTIRQIGKVEILRFQTGKCATKIVQENPGFQISEFDFAEIGMASSRQNNTPIELQQVHMPNKMDFFGYGSIGAGIVMAGVGYLYYSQARSNYSDYQNAKTVNDAVRLYDKTVSLDKKANVFFGAGGGLVVFGILYKWMNRDRTSTNAYQKYTIKPECVPGYTGVKLSFNLNSNNQ